MDVMVASSAASHDFQDQLGPSPSVGKLASKPLDGSDMADIAVPRAGE